MLSFNQTGLNLLDANVQNNEVRETVGHRKNDLLMKWCANSLTLTFVLRYDDLSLLMAVGWSRGGQNNSNNTAQRVLYQNECLRVSNIPLEDNFVSTTHIFLILLLSTFISTSVALLRLATLTDRSIFYGLTIISCILYCYAVTLISLSVVKIARIKLFQKSFLPLFFSILI